MTFWLQIKSFVQNFYLLKYMTFWFQIMSSVQNFKIYWNLWLFECKLRVLCKNLQLFNWKWISVRSLHHYNEITICVKFTSKCIFFFWKKQFFFVISSIIPFNCYTYIAITLQSKQKLSTKILTAKLFLQWCNTYQ